MSSSTSEPNDLKTGNLKTLDGVFPLAACLPTEIGTLRDLPLHPSTASAWHFEPKLDGHRVLIDWRGDEPRILNRNGSPYGAGPFRLEVPEQYRGCVIDGEYLPPRHGIQDGRAYFAAFDMLVMKNGEVITSQTQNVRNNLLYAMMQGVPDDRFLVIRSRQLTQQIFEELHEEGKGYFTGDYAENLQDHLSSARARLDCPIDGVVFKQQYNNVYHPGKTKTWLKYKFTAQIDCVVTALNIDSKSNCELSIYDGMNEMMHPIGRASTAGKGPIDVDSVVTVQFLEFTRGLRLREPRILTTRNDKAPEACTVDQLVPHYRRFQASQ